MHGFRETDEDRATHDRVADVELFDLWNRGDRSDVRHGQSVSRMNCQSELRAAMRGVAQRANRHGIARRVGVWSGVQLDRGGAERVRVLDRLERRRDEETRANPRRIETRNAIGEATLVARNVEASLGGDLLTTLGHQRDLMRPKTLGNAEHLVRAGHLEIQHCLHRCGETLDVVVLNVTAVFAQMCGDPVGARRLAERSPGNRVRARAAARLSHGGDVIDVDVQALMFHRGQTVSGGIRLKKLIMLFALLAACRSTTTTTVNPAPAPSGNATGGQDAQAAVRGFMTAAKNQDLQAMGALFGDTYGAARERIGRDELEKRELIMMCYLRHDRYDLLGEAPAPGGGRAVAVSVTYKDITRSTNFDVVRGPESRWYVKSFDINSLQDICSRKG